MSEIEQVQGYSLFNDVEDKDLRCRNRAVVMANIFEDNIDVASLKMKPSGAAVLIRYQQQIDEAERKQVHETLLEILEERGYVEEVKNGD